MFSFFNRKNKEKSDIEIIINGNPYEFYSLIKRNHPNPPKKSNVQYFKFDEKANCNESLASYKGC